MSVTTSVHVWERKGGIIKISFILITNFEAAWGDWPIFFQHNHSVLFLKSSEEFLLKVSLKYLPIAHSKYFFLSFCTPMMTGLLSPSVITV